jgi:prepilin-type N-terminal cleavage/methylation domain-containing protein
MSERTSREDGMTLIEVLLVVMLIGIVTPAIVGAMIISFRNTGDTRTRMIQSHHANLTATYLNADVASATDVKVNGAAGTACSGVSNKLLLSWQETIVFPSGSSVTTPFAAAYAVVPDGSGAFTLKRWRCENGTVTETKTLARDLPAATSVTANASANNVTLGVDQSDGNDESYSFQVGGEAGVRIT